MLKRLSDEKILLRKVTEEMQLRITNIKRERNESESQEFYLLEEINKQKTEVNRLTNFIQEGQKKKSELEEVQRSENSRQEQLIKKLDIKSTTLNEKLKNLRKQNDHNNEELRTMACLVEKHNDRFRGWKEKETLLINQTKELESLLKKIDDQMFEVNKSAKDHRSKINQTNITYISNATKEFSLQKKKIEKHFEALITHETKR